MVSYERFVVLMPTAFGPLSAYLKSLYGKCSGISFVDSTALAVCDNHRIHNTFGVLLITRIKINVKTD